MTNKLSVKDQTSEFLLYTAPDGDIKVEVLLSDETIWLTQKRMAELFGVGVPAISKHLENIYESGELQREATISILETVQQEGSREVKRKLEYYNLDAVISVGYRVNSTQATQFRIWATQLIKEYIIKGFAMDDERLKNGQYFGKDYFKELLERVRSIRASERRIYQQITDIFAECSIDYDPKSETTRQFYAHVQDKFHYAITGHTSAEIISLKADATKPLMGMTTYKNAPKGRVLKSDTIIAKNYLSETEIKQLERTVSSFFDYIEGIIERRNTFTMEAFAASVDKFLAFNEYQILEGYGSVSRAIAKQKAYQEYEQFNKQQKIESDFDREVKKLLQKKETKE
ncbi:MULTISPECIES: virulence RhuM family protein [Idiomarina]|uniref:virulence RhuM family protein n=1 Tax=Idiomarina TaxID=135575 RepID=UPI00129B965E|nr:MULTISPECIES: virulence RhuM family protein [Idiomarina]MRJ41254.1 cell filamentation protein Fic [Idiomarina sp. FeN1]NCU56419.1 cell filamentation protein Fic [Idiomarina sp. FenA--70]NCU59438.1 cell filamentation protein Fic [Idiomarina sp. FenBw--71]UUN12610.1 virulence RhuM family protein [Idiomarina loihiensis]